MSETNSQNCSEKVPPAKEEWQPMRCGYSRGMRGGLDWMYSVPYLYAMLIALRPDRSINQGTMGIGSLIK